MNNIHNMHVHSKPVLHVQMGTIRTFLGVQYNGYYSSSKAMQDASAVQNLSQGRTL